ncbi:hypothetical protein D3C71_1442740 [compost metagenome]
MKRDIQTDRFIRKHLDHQPRCAGAATGRPADFVVVGLISQRPAQRVLRQGQPEELQGGHHARRSHRLDIGGILIHGAAAADGARHCLEVVALIGRVRGVERLFVGSGTGGCPTPRALAEDDDVIAAPLHFHRSPQPGGTGADHDAAGAMNRDIDATEHDHLLGTGRIRQTRHVHIRERVKNMLRDGRVHERCTPRKLPFRLCLRFAAEPPDCGMTTEPERAPLDAFHCVRARKSQVQGGQVLLSGPHPSLRP